MLNDREDFRSDDDTDWEPDFEANDDLGRDFPEYDPDDDDLGNDSALHFQPDQ